MKMKALAGLSTPSGYVKKGAEFTTDAATGKQLIERKIAVEADSAKAKPAKAE